MKKVGIITMHKVPNYGSALQAYALQNKVESLGCNAELIDYCYPNRNHCAGQGVAYFPQKKMYRLFVPYVLGLLLLMFGVKSQEKKARAAIFRYKHQKNFRGFYIRWFKLSRFYETAESLQDNPPSYDLYMTGSDQVWNPHFIVGDGNFLLSFAPEDKPRLSYAASFSGRSIDKKDESFFSNLLCKYQSISVRESSGVSLVERLTGKDAVTVCDPTLLLDKNEWMKVCPSKSLMKGKYLLLYIQSYAYNPYPNIIKFTEKLSEKFGLHVVVVWGLAEGYSIERASYFDCAGPSEFLQLLRDASLVVTTSFHGTAFALNFQKDFYSVVKKIDDNDSRVVDFLRQCGAEHHLIEIAAADSLDNLPEAATAENEMEELASFRKKSMEWLKYSLQN